MSHSHDSECITFKEFAEIQGVIHPVYPCPFCGGQPVFDTEIKLALHIKKYHINEATEK